MANNPPRKNYRKVFKAPAEKFMTEKPQYMGAPDPNRPYPLEEAFFAKNQKLKDRAQYLSPEWNPSSVKGPGNITAPTYINPWTKPLATPGDLTPEQAADQLQKNKFNDTVAKGVDGVKAMAPYVSNIINSFRRPPSPAAPRMISPVSLGRVNYGASRAEAEQQVYGANQGVNVLGENQATAVRSANLVSGIKSINRINEAEANQNTQIGNSEAQLNAGINAQNTGMWNNYQDQKVNQEMVDQQQRSANISNAADKFIGIGNQEKMMELEATKYSILNKMYDPSGVNKRFTAGMPVDPKTGIPVYEKNKYGGKLKYMAGGMLRKVYNDPPTKGGMPVAKTLEADRTMGGTHVLSPQTHNYMRDEADMLRKKAVFERDNPGVDPVAYAATQRATQGYIDPKSGDWFPTEYNKPGRQTEKTFDIIMANNTGAKKFIEKKLRKGGKVY